MTHIRHQQDADLHTLDGSHLSTPPTTAGTVIENWERRIRYHLHCHQVELEQGRDGYGNPVSGRDT